MYASIDSIPLGDIPWQSFEVGYSGELDSDDTTAWKRDKYEVWFRDPRLVLHQMLGNSDFKGKMDYAPKVVVDQGGQRVYQNFMSGDWAWDKAVRFLFACLTDDNIYTDKTH